MPDKDDKKRGEIEMLQTLKDETYRSLTRTINALSPDDRSDIGKVEKELARLIVVLIEATEKELMVLYCDRMGIDREEYLKQAIEAGKKRMGDINELFDLEKQWYPETFLDWLKKRSTDIQKGEEQ
jgi:hypothetical protein